MTKRLLSALAAAAVAIASTSAADAAVVINVKQSGSSVIATGHGTYDMAALMSGGSGKSSLGAIRIALAGLSGFEYFSLTGPAAVGTIGGFRSATSTGKAISLGLSGIGVLGKKYVSSAPLSGTKVLKNTSYATLGLIPGHYVFTSAYNTIVLNIDAAPGAVPEPASWAMMLMGAAGIGAALRRRPELTPRTA